MAKKFFLVFVNIMDTYSLYSYNYKNRFSIQLMNNTQTMKNNHLSPVFKGKNVYLLNSDVFVREGLIKPNEELNTFLDKVIDICSNQNKKLKKNVIDLINQKKIVLSKSIYRTALSKKEPIGTCSILINSDLTPKRQILQGNGLAINITGKESAFDILTRFDQECLEYGRQSPRKPAGIAIVEIFNSDIERFINYANDKNFSEICHSTSVKIPISFFDMVDKDKLIKLNSGKQISVRYLYNSILKSISKNGNPGFIFSKIDTCNPIPSHPYEGVSTCAEMGLENRETAMFSYVNINEFLEEGKLNYKKIYNATKVLSKFLDSIIDVNVNQNRYISDINAKKRRYGIGVIGYADLLAKMNLSYGSNEALKVLSYILETINYATKKTSVELAKDKGEFPLFKKSRYNESSFFIKHSDCESPITENMWKNLYKRMSKYHLRNATTTALAPSCSSARMTGVSYSIEPYLNLKNIKIFYQKLDNLNLSSGQKQQVIEAVNNTGSCQNIEFLPQYFKDIFKNATEIDYKKHIDTVSTAQNFVDDAISKTINLSPKSSVSDIDKAVRYANDKGLKGITFYINRDM